MTSKHAHDRRPSVYTERMLCRIHISIEGHWIGLFGFHNQTRHFECVLRTMQLTASAPSDASSYSHKNNGKED